jgi:LacI family transcriptional regulator
MPITRNDVAKLAGVSTATVSYVVNNGPRPVSEGTRQKVLRAIQQLGYQPSAVARSLKTKKTCTIGIIISDILNPLLAFIAQSIEDELLPADYNLILCNTKELPERELAYLKMLISKQADGVIILPTGANRNILFSMIESGKHMVLLDRVIEGLDVDYVLFDNEDGAYAAVRHLISLGHSRIGMINLPPELTPGAGRLRGYERALHDAGLDIDRTLVKSGSFTAQEAHSLAHDLLSLDNPPTALFASSNRLARGVLQLVKERQLRMPNDLALCVFDDVGYYSHITPSITAVAHDYRQSGREAARLLMERIDGCDDCPARVVTLPYELHVRESTAGPSARPDRKAQPRDYFAESPIPVGL